MKKTLPAIIFAGIALASCVKQPTEEVAVPPLVLPEKITPVENDAAATAGNAEQAVLADGSGAMNVAASGASATIGTDGSVSVSASGASAGVTANGAASASSEGNSVTSSSDGSMTVSTPETGSMTVGNGKVSAPGISIGTDGSANVDAGAVKMGE